MYKFEEYRIAANQNNVYTEELATQVSILPEVPAKDATDVFQHPTSAVI